MSLLSACEYIAHLGFSDINRTVGGKKKEKKKPVLSNEGLSVLLWVLGGCMGF